MKILFCSHEQFMPLSGGGTVGNLEIVRNLIKRGHQVTVSTPLFIDPEEVEDKYGVTMCDFSPFYMHRSARHRLIRYACYALLFIFHLAETLSRKKYDVVIIRNSVLASSAMFLLPFFRRTRFYISYTDFLGSFLFEAPNVPRFIARILFFYERTVPRLFDGIFVISPRMKHELVRSGVPAERIHITHDGVNIQDMNPGRVAPEDINRLKENHRANGKKIVLFHGTIEPHHGTDIITKIIEETLKQKEDISFFILGVGKDYRKLQRKINHPDVHFPGFVSGYELVTYLASADVGFIPYQRSRGLDMVYTLKLLEYFAMDLPVVCFDHLTIKETFSGLPYIKIVNSMDEFVRSIIILSEDSFLEGSDRPRKIIEQKFTWENVTDVIEGAILNVNAGQ